MNTKTWIHDNCPGTGMGLVVVLALLATVSVWIILSFFEARAFERATGKKVSVFDAMFIELRVQESMEEKPKE